MKIGGSNEHHSALTGLTACSEAALLPCSSDQEIQHQQNSRFFDKSNVVNMKAYFLTLVFHWGVGKMFIPLFCHHI